MTYSILFGETMKKYFAIIIIILSFSACSTTQYYSTLEPDGIEFLQENGKNIVVHEDSIITILTHFEEFSEVGAVFYTEITNNSSDSIYVNPNDFFYVSDNPNTQYSTKNAINPENKIKEIQYSIENQDIAHNISIGANLFFGFLGVAVAVADDDPEFAFESAINTSGNIIEESLYYNEQMDYAKSSITFWQEEVLHPKTLAPEEYCSGFVFFPFREDAQKFNIIYNIDSHSAEIPYKFIKIRIK